MTHEKSTAVVWGTEPPAHSIGREKPMWPGDSGFTVLFDDAPEPDEVHGPEDPRVSLVCLHCLLDDHPEIGRGLDIARQYGVADLDENDEWVVGDRLNATRRQTLRTRLRQGRFSPRGEFYEREVVRPAEDWLRPPGSW